MDKGHPTIVPTISLTSDIFVTPYSVKIIDLNEEVSSQKLLEDIEKKIVKYVYVYFKNKSKHKNTDIGVLCEVAKGRREREVILNGIVRVKKGEAVDKAFYEKVPIEAYEDDPEDFTDLKPAVDLLKQRFLKYAARINGSQKITKEDLKRILWGLKRPIGLEDLNKIVWLIINLLPDLDRDYKDLFLQSTHVNERMILCIAAIDAFMDKLSMSNVEPGSKEDLLMELGREIASNQDLSRRFKKFIEIINSLPEDAQNAIEDNLRKLKDGGRTHNEYSMFLAHVDTLLGLPWDKESEQEADILNVEAVLNNDHAHLDFVKRRICDFIAPKILNPKGKAGILCFVGPPGVGKTSLGDSIARALKRKFVRMSVGGLHDEAEIRGHRVTYIGAKFGRVIELIKNCGFKNPVFMIDEIDKIDKSVRGDPSSALLEVLDPEQNHSFVDHYLGIGFDLTQVLFICTANVEEDIPEPLRDRMDIIRLPGYLEIEKIEIATRFIIPRVINEVGLSGKINIIWPAEAISKIIREYTREAGVRGLTHRITDILKKIAGNYLKHNRNIKEFKITASTIESMLGPPKYTSQEAKPTGVGVAIGLAWTPYGGEILRVQSKFFPAVKKGEFTFSQTGLQKEIMREANKAALTLIRNRVQPDQANIENRAIHLHIPEGAIPKDGPSAGITTFCSLYSLFTGKKIRPFVAMTGELGLEDEVAEVGGIKEKVVAAMRAGIKEVILPKANERNLYDVPKEVKDKIKFHFVSTVDELIEIVFKNEDTT